MEDGIERSVSMLLETMDKIKSSNNDKKKPPISKGVTKSVKRQEKYISITYFHENNFSFYVNVRQEYSGDYGRWFR
jgi:hypothetical protein